MIRKSILIAFTSFQFLLFSSNFEQNLHFIFDCLHSESESRIIDSTVLGYEQAVKILDSSLNTHKMQHVLEETKIFCSFF